MTKDLQSGSIINKVIDNSESGLLVSAMIGGASVLQPAAGNLSEIRDFVQNIFNVDYLKEEDASFKQQTCT